MLVTRIVSKIELVLYFKVYPDITKDGFPKVYTQLIIGVGDLLLSTLQLYDPAITTNSILTLSFNVEDSLLFPFTWTVACVLCSLWKHRTSPAPGRRVDTLTRVRGDVLATAQMLGKTRMLNNYELTKQILEEMFPP